jgi:hypothetical protein
VASLAVEAFIARFLQHLLPRGFTKVRHYGILSPSHRLLLERARSLIELHAAPTPDHSAAVGNRTTSSRGIRMAAVQHPPGTEDVTTVVLLSGLRCCACEKGTLVLIARYRRARGPP